MTEGTIINWLKREGDEVIEDEEIAEVETEKVTSMLVAPASGTLSRKCKNFLLIPGTTV